MASRQSQEAKPRGLIAKPLLFLVGAWISSAFALNCEEFFGPTTKALESAKDSFGDLSKKIDSRFVEGLEYARFRWLYTREQFEAFFQSLPAPMREGTDGEKLKEMLASFAEDQGEFDIVNVFDANKKPLPHAHTPESFIWGVNSHRPFIDLSIDFLHADPKNPRAYVQALSTLRHELEHYQVWKEMRDLLKQLGHADPSSKAWELVMQGENYVTSERRALVRELRTKKSLLEALGITRSANSYLESDYLLSTATYPESEAIRSAAGDIVTLTRDSPSSQSAASVQGKEEFIRRALKKALTKSAATRRRVYFGTLRRLEAYQKISPDDVQVRSEIFADIRFDYNSMTGDLIELVTRGSGGFGASSRYTPAERVLVQKLYDEVYPQLLNESPELFSFRMPSFGSVLAQQPQGH